MARRMYGIVLHMFDEQNMLPRVDQRYYTYQKLFDCIGRCRLIPEGVDDTNLFDIYANCEDTNEKIHVVCDEDIIKMFHRNVVIVEVHVWIHAESITPLGVELHGIDLDADKTHVEDVDELENAMQDECDSVRGARLTNEDDGLMSVYSSDDAPLDAVSENKGDEDESEDEDESDDPIKNYLHRNIYEEIYKARKKAFEQIDGSYGGSYSKLPHYAEMVRRSNHGNLVKLQCNHDENDDKWGSVQASHCCLHSRGFLWGLDALKKGFLQGCSPFLEFDSCHLKGIYGGVLLTAVSLDGNNGLFPLAFVVESECKNN
ncbi:UNVERIFIED_CONTAM: hypothetical protein Sradi_3355000 [Sesamum radiatum]|uniref:Transposase n=1 Tax=Sesamum radiatum TaxID=300843 RepID=A0AAW2R3J4_SESRA